MRRKRRSAGKKHMLGWDERKSDLIAEIDRRIDLFYGNYEAFDPKIYELLNERDFNSRQANVILHHYLPTLKEINDAYQRVDPEINEAYRNLSSVQLSNYLKFLHYICNDLAQYSVNKRKKRVKGVRPAASILKFFTYQKEDAKLKVVSSPPESILGASSVLLYNTKYHKITLLIAKDDKGLSVYRKAIINYDEEKSVTKVSRKLNISQFMNGVYNHVKRLMDEIPTKPYPLAYRVYEDVLILRTFR